MPGRSGGKLRYRICYNPKTKLWYCAKLDNRGNETSRSPEGSSYDAEQFEATMRRYGAWHKS